MRYLRTLSKMSSASPINLVSVNTAPERARKVIGAVIEGVKDRHALVHAGNAESESLPPHLPISTTHSSFIT